MIVDDYKQAAKPIEPLVTADSICSTLLTNQEDEYTSIAVNEKLLVVGCKSGRLIAVDCLGNLLDFIKLPMHNSRIVNISIDASGEIVASASEDGQFYICNVMESCEVIVNMLVESGIVDFCLSPHYSIQKCFIVKTQNKLIYYNKSKLFNKYFNSVIYTYSRVSRQANSLCWHANNIAFEADNNRVFIFDSINRLMYTEKIDEQSNRSNESFCMYWSDPNTIVCVSNSVLK
ncbi:hypothetical protein GJ496_006035, partial [Pomphorhynchus laevis]